MQIVGIDNPGDRFGGGNDVVGKLKINKTKPTILMYHPPLGLEDANKAGVNLQISGHTHNGQIIPFNLVSKIFYPRVNGLYKYKGTYLYTSPGTGTWGPPMRLGSINEITLVRLVNK
jgi:predicted MPP superfamily phosphohydrolase